MMKSILFLFLGIVLLTLAVSATADITPNDRLLQRPERDGAVVQRSWAEGAFRLQEWDTDLGELEYGCCSRRS
jgi:hypothetical protein